MEPIVEVIEGLNPFTREPETWVRLTYPSGNVWNLTLETAREVAASLFHYDLDKHHANG